MKKKIIYIVLLLIVIIGIILFFVFQVNIKKEDNNFAQQTVGMRNSNDIDKEGKNKNEVKNETNKEIKNIDLKDETIVTELEDGTLYSITDQKIKPDIILGDKFFDTQINDIMINFNRYKGKIVEIEGMYIDVYNPYTIVGRYSANSLCASCPPGYSGFEYIWNGSKIDVKNEETWLKVIGKLSVGNDESTNYQDYYYIEAYSIEVMNESGLKTVTN